MKNTKKQIVTMGEYIQSFPSDIQTRLKQIRAIVKEIAPQAEESISYKMPTFKINGHYFLYFAAFKNHISIFPFVNGVEELKEIEGKYKTSGRGTIQFPNNEPLPEDGIRKIAEYSLKNLAKTYKSN